MRLSPLQLERYILTDFGVRPNPHHDIARGVELEESDMQVAHEHVRDGSDPRRWFIRVRVVVAGEGRPRLSYLVTVDLMGWVRFTDGFEAPDLEQLASVNGSSLLYGVARELVRSATALGPFPALLLPALSFRPEANPPSGSHAKAGGV